MKAVTRVGIQGAALLVLGMLMASSTAGLAGENNNDKGEHLGKSEHARDRGPWRTESREFRKQLREKIETHMKAQFAENRAQRDSLKNEEDPYKIVAAIKSQRVTQHTENVTFFNGIHDEAVAFMQSMFEKYETPAEKRAEITEKQEQHYAVRKEKHEKIYTKMINGLDALAAKEGLTKKDIGKAMKKWHKKRARHRKCGGKSCHKNRSQQEDK